LALAEHAQRESKKLFAKLHAHLGRVSWQMGRHEEAVAHLQTAIQMHEQMGDSIAPLYQRMNLSAAYVAAGEYGKGLAEAQNGLRLAQSINHAYLLAVLNPIAAEASFYLGQLDEAEHYAAQCMRQEEATMQPYAFTVIGMVQRARGQYPSSQNTLRTAIVNAQQIEDPYAEACAWRELGRTLRAAANAVEARAALDEAVRLFERMGLVSEVVKTDLTD
jgi:tetratricopeptide (TPR) repeat protein